MELAWVDSVWGELLGENFERRNASRPMWTVVGGNWWVRIVREEPGASLGGE